MVKYTDRLRFLCVCLSLSALSITAQEKKEPFITARGSIQSDILIPQEDNAIGTGEYKDWGLTNTYASLSLLNKYVQAGARFEFTQYPLPGFEKDFKGWGVPNFFITGKYKNVELTAGDFYDQFGSGFIFRTYEERSLGVDNSLRGGRLAVNIADGVRIKALGGKQRCYWEHNNSWVYGGDVELNIDRYFPKMAESDTHLLLGGSFVSRHEGDEDINVIKPIGEVEGSDDATLGAYKLNFPKNVGAFDVRAQFQKQGFNVLAEYAGKGQDPSFDNGYIYHYGSAAMLSGSYSKKGMSVLLQAKRSEDMGYRSERSKTGTSSFINHLPAFSMQQTYALASLYPYATQNTKGEWAFQAELGYTFKRKTALGGKYGTNVKLNVSHIRALDKTPVSEGDLKGTKGYTTTFFGMGDDVYYQDINVQIEKKITHALKVNFMYMNQRYNKTVVEGEGGMVNSNIAIADVRYQFNPKLILRTEVQYLNTRDDEGDWWYGLTEFTVLPSLMFTISDMYNSGSTKLHYYMGSVSYTFKAHRLQVGYGRTRAGFNCSGGVCRYVPASKGVQVSYNFNF